VRSNLQLAGALIVAMSILVTLGACERQGGVAPSGKIVKIGVIGPSSGEFEAMGLDGGKGLEAARELHPLLANGDTLELVKVDNLNDPGLTGQAIRHLAQDERLAAVMLLSTSEAALATGVVADAEEIPVLSLFATHTGVTQGHDFMSQLAFDNAFQGSVAALFVRDELLLERVAVIRDPGSVYSAQLADEFVRKFESIGGVITGTHPLQEDSDGYKALMESLRSLDTELLYMPVNAEHALTIVDVAGELAWSPSMMGSDGLLASALNRRSDDAGMLEGLYATDFVGVGMVLSDYGRRIEKVYRTRFGEPGTTYAVLGVEGYRVLRLAMNRCENPVDRECVNRMIRDTRGLEGVTGLLSIGRDGRAVRPVVVNAIRDGYMEVVVKVY
jgi:branched-chain amino acid transport system substrate-binding protein